jgi:regulator of protease activity HflC (stomatin/prohibitin superfamily)
MLFFRGTKLRRSGRGLAFWFSPFAASVAEVPVDNREVTFAIHGRSADFQDVVVQGNVTYRVAEPAATAARIDFAIDLRHGTHLRQPLEKLASVLTQLAQQRALSYVKDAPLREVVLRGHEGIRAAIEEGMAGYPVLTDLGLVLVSVRIASVKPSAEVERALEAPTRERIQEEADEATFRRRAQAVEKERAIQENELQNQIELARREQQLIEQRGQNARRDATEKAEAGRIEAEGDAERTRIGGEAQGGSIRVVEGARVAIDRERLEAYRTMPAAVLAALAAQELAKKLQNVKIDHLSITPELLGPIVTDLLQAGTRRLEKSGGEKAR